MATTTDKKPTYEEMVATLGDISKRLEAAEKMDTSKNRLVHEDELGRVTGFFEGTDEEVDLKFTNDTTLGGSVRRDLKSHNNRNRRLLKKIGYKQSQEYPLFGDFLKFGLRNRSNPAAIEKFIGDQLKPVLEYESEYIKNMKAVQGMSTAVGSDGGYTILPEYAPGFIDRVYQNTLWSMTDNYNVVGNSMTFLATAETSRATGSRAGGIQGYWMDEGDALTKSKPTTRQITLKLHKLGILVYLTDELLGDSGFGLQQYVSRKASDEFNFMIGDALVNGDGVAKPMGMLNFPSFLSITKESGQSAATIQPENVVKAYARFYMPNLANAVWLHNQDIGPSLDLMTLGIGAAGIAVYMPPNGMADKPFATLRGIRSMATEFNPTLGTVGDLMLADMGQILSISKGSIAQAVSMHVEFLTDQLAVRFIMRLNAAPWENAPITPYKGTNTQSNFIGIATRA